MEKIEKWKKSEKALVGFGLMVYIKQYPAM